MKRICFLVDSIFSYGGVQRVTAVIAKELAKTYDVSIVTFDNPKDKDTSLYELETAKINYKFFAYPVVSAFYNKICKAYSYIYKEYRLQSRWASNIYARSSFPAPLRKALTKELKNGNYDIIIGVHAPLASRLATMKKKLPNAKCIGWIHNSFEALFGEKGLYIGAERKRHYIYQFRKLDHTIVLCQQDAETYHLYDPAFKTIVIYNPLTLKPGAPSTGTTKTFLAVGRFSRLHKGFDLLIEAFHLFSQKNQEWRLDIVGEGVEEELYRSLIKKYSLEDRVTIHPFTNQIQDHYSNAQVYVLSSRWEGMPLVLVEAMSHGLPIVTSDIPVSQEILGEFGLYFKNGNITELAERLEEATHIDWNKKSQEALEIARRFDITNIISSWKNLIEND